MKPWNERILQVTQEKDSQVEYNNETSSDILMFFLEKYSKNIHYCRHLKIG